MLDERLSESITVLAEGVVVLSVPKVPIVYNDVIDFVHAVVGEADWDALFQLKTASGRRLVFVLASFHAHDTTEVVVMATVGEHVVVKLDRGVIEAEAQPLEQVLVHTGHMIDAQVNNLRHPLRQHPLLFAFIVGHGGLRNSSLGQALRGETICVDRLLLKQHLRVYFLNDGW